MWGGRGAAGGCVAAAAADLVEVAVYLALVAGEAHSHALALVALASRGPHHLALLAVLEPVAALEGVARSCVVDLLAHRVAARQRRWRLAAYLCAPVRLVRGAWDVGQLVGLGDTRIMEMRAWEDLGTPC